MRFIAAFALGHVYVVASLYLGLVELVSTFGLGEM
jgi:hypothetical protein